jgi:hypothetical protein
MKHLPEGALCIKQFGGRLVRVCAILVLLAARWAPGVTGADRHNDGSIGRLQPGSASSLQ